jgi:hypothetical protein
MKKTRRILPKGQRPIYGSRSGVLGHPDDCGCRSCRRLRVKGATRRQESRGTHEGN